MRYLLPSLCSRPWLGPLPSEPSPAPPSPSAEARAPEVTREKNSNVPRHCRLTSRIDLVDGLHALGHLRKRRKPHAVQVRVIGQVDEHLRGAAILARSRERQEAAFVRADDGVVEDLFILPLGRDLEQARKAVFAVWLGVLLKLDGVSHLGLSRNTELGH